MKLHRTLSFLAASLLAACPPSLHAQDHAAQPAPAAAPAITLKEIQIPKDQALQQAILGYQEYRYAFEFTKPIPESILFAEFFVDGKMVRRVRLAEAAHYNSEKMTKGFFSFAWLPGTHELVSITDIDNQFPGIVWHTRHTIPPEILGNIAFARYAQTPPPEPREGKWRADDKETAKSTVYPLVALYAWDAGTQNSQVPPSGESTEGFSGLAQFMHFRQYAIIYLYIGGVGGAVPFHIDEGMTDKK